MVIAFVIQVLFLMLYPLAADLHKEHENSGFGFKHWFQDELALVLIKRGREMQAEEHVDKHAKVGR